MSYGTRLAGLSAGAVAGLVGFLLLCSVLAARQHSPVVTALLVLAALTAFLSGAVCAAFIPVTIDDHR